MLPRIEVDTKSDVPLYRQLHEQVRKAILSGKLVRGERLPPTRELAGLLGLNRTTVAAAYELLESEGLIKGHVGRGSFVTVPELAQAERDWEQQAPAEDTSPARSSTKGTISFASSRPSELLFPLDEFRVSCREVIDSPEAAQILQLGPASGYGPLRRYLWNEARRSETASSEDDVLVTSGCQQGFDLIQRVFASRGETVVLEDPVYPGLRNVFVRGGSRVLGAPVGPDGIEIEAFGRILDKEKPRLVVLTPSFQNPTGTTLPLEARRTILAMAKRAGVIIVENDLYSDLRYHGTPISSIKQLDNRADTIILGSFSKIAFPGLRVGWALGPRHFIEKLTDAKESSDLHSDQLAQAVVLRFAESGRLEAHRNKMLTAGAERLKACLSACAKELPKGSHFTRPEGGMNVWVRLPEPLDSAELAMRADNEGVSYIPGRYFAVTRPQTHGLRLSFAGLPPDKIHQGVAVLGKIFRDELERARAARRGEPSPAMV